MRSVRSILKLVVIIILISLAAFFSPEIGLGAEWDVIITVTAFLFGILSGFAITILWNRLSTVRRNLLEEGGNSVSILLSSRAFETKIYKKIEEAVSPAKSPIQIPELPYLEASPRK